MPTPFMHLHASEGLRTLALTRRDLDGRLLNGLCTAWPAFYFGSVAPDYQTICGIPRSDTHFYKMPPDSRSQGQQNMIAQFPQLYPGSALEPDQAAFIAAYLLHLRLDLDWHFDVVLPYFANSAIIEDPRQGYLLHVMLLAYLDNLAYQSLPDTAPAALAAAEIRQWLPFATDGELETWRDFLLEQMAPQAATRTVQIFARRLRMTPDEFTAKLNDPEWMNKELFSRIPVSKIQRQLNNSVTESLDLVDAYWNGRFD